MNNFRLFSSTCKVVSKETKANRGKDEINCYQNVISRMLFEWGRICLVDESSYFIRMNYSYGTQTLSVLVRDMGLIDAML